jgi:hypothetical protein
MTDFLDRFGAQLLAAEQGLAATPARSRPRRRWRTRRGAILALAGLAVAVPALAETQPWQPILGRPALHDTPAGTSNSPVPTNEFGLLGVLRRPQNDTDRGPIAQRLLAGVGSEYKGVRLTSVRLLTSTDGHHALLVPTEQHGISPRPGKYETANTVCLELSSGGFCGGAEQIRLGDFLGSAAGPAGGSLAELAGLVPDGVASVVVSFPNGQTLSSDVRDNFFSVTGVPLDDRSVNPPPRRSTTPVPPMKVQEQPKIEWLDASGKRVGPPGALGG